MHDDAQIRRREDNKRIGHSTQHTTTTKYPNGFSTSRSTNCILRDERQRTPRTKLIMAPTAFSGNHSLTPPVFDQIYNFFWGEGLRGRQQADMEGFVVMISVRGRAEDFELWGGHKPQFFQPSLQPLELPSIFRGTNVVSHRVPNEDHTETYPSTTTPDTVRKDRETARLGEVYSNNTHGCPVVSQWIVYRSPFRVFTEEVVDSC